MCAEKKKKKKDNNSDSGKFVKGRSRGTNKSSDSSPNHPITKADPTKAKVSLKKDSHAEDELAWRQCT